MCVGCRCNLCSCISPYFISCIQLSVIYNLLVDITYGYVSRLCMLPAYVILQQGHLMVNDNDEQQIDSSEQDGSGSQPAPFEK